MYIIGLDDGHGLETIGKQTPQGYKENEFNHFTKEFLKADLIRCGFKVVDCSPLRSDNSLSNRADIANKNNCNAFVSIHYNAMGNVWNDNVGGIETFHHPDAPTLGGAKLAKLVHAELIKGTPLKNRGVKTANFAVLRLTKMAACLVECGFMDNPYEAELMKSDNYRKECSEEICKGLCNYFNVKFIESPQLNQGTERERAIKMICQVSKWADEYIREFDAIQQKGINVWGLINKFRV